jgi:hypothetical protein
MVQDFELAISQIPRVQSKSEWSRPEWICIWQRVSSYADNPTPQEKQDMEQWIRITARTLPCVICQEHF